MEAILPDEYNDKTVALIILVQEEPAQVREPSASYNYGNLYGATKLGLSLEEVDQELKELRHEWERDIS